MQGARGALPEHGEKNVAEKWVTMGELTMLVGEDAAMTLCSHLGGIRIYIPKRPDLSTRLGRVAGWRAMSLLCEVYGGREVTFPNRRRGEGQKKIVLEGLAAGLSIRQIAESAEVTERYVRAVARMYGGRRQQGSLLD